MYDTKQATRDSKRALASYRRRKFEKLQRDGKRRFDRKPTTLWSVLAVVALLVIPAMYA